MQCEVCGREIIGEAHRVLIEGVKMITCTECAVLGSDTWIPEPKKLKRITEKEKKLSRDPSPAKKEEVIKIAEEVSLIDNLGLLVRQRREKLGLSHEDLARKIGEKVSVIRRIESGKMSPDDRLTVKLEHALKIELHTSVMDEGTAAMSSLPNNRGVTLGEIAILKTRKKGGSFENEGNNSQP